MNFRMRIDTPQPRVALVSYRTKPTGWYPQWTSGDILFTPWLVRSTTIEFTVRIWTAANPPGHSAVCRSYSAARFYPPRSAWAKFKKFIQFLEKCWEKTGKNGGQRIFTLEKWRNTANPLKSDQSPQQNLISTQGNGGILKHRNGAWPRNLRSGCREWFVDKKTMCFVKKLFREFPKIEFTKSEAAVAAFWMESWFCGWHL